MEDIFSILASEGIELTDEAKKNVKKKISSEYKTIAEYSNLKAKFEDATRKLSDLDSLNTKLENLTNENAELTKFKNEANLNACKYKILQSGVNERFVDFVNSEVQKQVNESNSFEDVLKNFIETNDQYLNVQKSEPQAVVATSPSFMNKSELMPSTDEIMNRYLRGEL